MIKYKRAAFIFIKEAFLLALCFVIAPSISLFAFFIMTAIYEDVTRLFNISTYLGSVILVIIGWKFVYYPMVFVGLPYLILLRLTKARLFLHMLFLALASAFCLFMVSPCLKLILFNL